MTMRSIAKLLSCLLSCIAATTAADAQAQTYPDKPVRVIVGLAAGGGTDLVMRTIAPKLAEALGQQVLVDNRTGAGGTIAADVVAKAPADGYTLLMAPSSTMVSNIVMKRGLPYATQDFTPISMIGTFPMLLLVDADAPPKTLAELVAYVKAQPAKANASGSGHAFELQAALLGQRAGAPITFIPYKSSSESVQALLGHEVLLTFADIGPALGALKANRVRPLASTAPQRLPEFANVPTFAEAGMPELQADYWMALFAPAKTPPAVVERLQAEMRKVLALPEIKAALKARWVDAQAETPAQLTARIQSEVRKWNVVRNAAGLAQVD